MCDISASLYDTTDESTESTESTLNKETSKGITVLPPGVTSLVFYWFYHLGVVPTPLLPKGGRISTESGVTSLDAYGHALLMPTLEAQFEVQR